MEQEQRCADRYPQREEHSDRPPRVWCPKCASGNITKSEAEHTNFYPDGSEEHFKIGGGRIECADCKWQGVRPDVLAALKMTEDSAWNRVGLSKPSDFKLCIVCHGPAPKEDQDVVSLSVWLRAHKKCREAWRNGDTVPLYVAPLVAPSMWSRFWSWIRSLFK